MKPKFKIDRTPVPVPIKSAPAAKPPEPPLPARRRIIYNAGKAALRAGGEWFRQGGRVPMLSAEQAEKALEICRDCDWYRHADDRCAHPGCGCFAKVKTRVATEKCPIGKWWWEWSGRKWMLNKQKG